jgi:hypothetical protein
MVEKEPKTKEFTTDDSGIYGIPSDTKSPWTMDFIIRYDHALQFTDQAGETGIAFPAIRFRKSGGPFNFIAAELSVLRDSFEKYNGQIPEYDIQNDTEDSFPSYVDTTVWVGKNPDESKYIIKGIPDGDISPNINDDTRYKSIDIEIAKNGNAIVTIRHTRRNNQASMEFKTAENGGKYPIMAEVFTRIAERIAKAKNNK